MIIQGSTPKKEGKLFTQPTYRTEAGEVAVNVVGAGQTTRVRLEQTGID